MRHGWALAVVQVSSCSKSRPILSNELCILMIQIPKIEVECGKWVEEYNEYIPPSWLFVSGL